jgi:hypothetical protein
MPITLEIESVNVKPGARVSQLFLDVHLQARGKLSNGQEIDMPFVFNILASNFEDGMERTRDLLKEFGEALMKSADRVSIPKTPAVEK